LKKLVVSMLIFMLVFPMQAWGYSYGDPTKEDIAETFLLIQTKVNASPADWEAAAAAYEVRRAEIASHFGESIAVTLDANFKAKQKDLMYDNYRYVLYLNLERRFTYAKADIDDYGASKLLIGKARGTYDVLKPYIQSNLPNEVSNIEEALNKTLESLGNPGLFGVGEKPIQPEVFDEQTGYILKTLKPIFSYTPAKAKEEPAAQQPKETAPDKTDPKESKPSTDTSSTTKTDAEEPASNAEDKSIEKVEEPSNEVKQTDESKSEIDENKAETDAVETSSSVKQDASIENGAAEVKSTDVVDESLVVQTDETEAEATTVDIAAADVLAEEHAPMSRTDKTNPIVSVIIIGAVVLIGGGVFLAKKKGII
jgi:hypothetical protein